MQDMTTREYLHGNTYPGRLIVAGVTPSGKDVFAYAIMGRSPNSRNRIFEKNENGLFTKPFDFSKVQDPSLIIYPAILKTSNATIVCNGDQSLDIKAALENGKTMEEGLKERTFEPDSPNYTPRISLVIRQDSFEFSILRRKADGSREYCHWSYPKEKGVLHIIHTYESDGNPLPSFEGEPVSLDSEDDYAAKLWKNLDKENRISLYVKEGDKETIINAREEEKK